MCDHCGMKRLVLFLLLLGQQQGMGQLRAFSNEDFVNAVARLIIDSSESQYYLSAYAPSCSFKKYDYEEWYKYGLKEDVPFYILNELSEKAYLDNIPLNWRQEKLLNAFCINDEAAKIVLSSVFIHHVKSQPARGSPAKMVYYFSRPAFTGDYGYAVIDIGFRCDDKQCGMGSTFLFRQVNGKWRVAGIKQVWGN